MLKVLIIDDSGTKIQEVAAVINKAEFPKKVEITTAGDLYGARKALQSTRYDLVVLDIVLPARPGEPPAHSECEGFLSDIGRDKTLKKPLGLIGLTAYQDYDQKINGSFAAYGWLLYNLELHRQIWPAAIVGRLKLLCESSLDKNESSIAQYDYDLAIVAALATPELTAVLEWPVDWQIKRIDGDYVEYHAGIFNEGGKTFKIVAAAGQQMGLVAATSLTLRMCCAFRPRVLAMVGIAAGVKGRTNLGDILVAEESWDYNSGKLGRSDSKRTFSPDPKSIRLVPEICELFQNPTRNTSLIDKAFSSWKGTLPPDRPKVVVGPVASGSSVVSDVEKVREIQNHNRKLIGLEMETFGVYFAAQHALLPKPQYLSVKAVCDFADEDKQDGFQTYAAHMSSHYLLELVRDGQLLGKW
jgi:nucleoside phosphorylase/CheY-like chemotaxis protein